ncbi:hypothetical protein DFH27DRAFT_569541 [Peziza echinospora]|nr:hypothetical protein DFH27DRAFT_569541 [Peziza echinospora]
MQIKFASAFLLAAACIAPVLAGPIANAAPVAVVDEIKEVGDSLGDLANSFGDWFKGIKLPTIENVDFNVPDDVTKFFKDAENTFKDAPDDLWKKIKDNQYPQEVTDWINSLPENKRDEARKDLREWADKYDGDSNAAGSLSGSVRVAVFSAAGVLAVALVL